MATFIILRITAAVTLTKT